jgi:patatin-like phospholipase/acyl hydrolase
MNHPKKRLVISLDGGGVRGAISASVLACIETQMLSEGVYLKDITSAVGGSSAGAINAALLAQRVPMPQVSENILNTTMLNKAFTKTTLAHVPLLGALFQQYCDENKLVELRKILNAEHPYRSCYCADHVCPESSDMRVEDIQGIKLLITSYNWTRQCINMFHNFSSGGNPQVLLHEAVHVSSSPPYFFPPHSVHFPHHDHHLPPLSFFQKEEEGFMENLQQEKIVPGIYPTQSGDFHCDGGVASNTPDIVLLGLSKKFWPLDEIHILSIGTGHNAHDDQPHSPFSSNIVGLLRSQMFGTMISASNEVNSMTCDMLCGRETKEAPHYLRIEMALPPQFDMNIVNFSPEHLEKLQKIGQDWFEAYRPQLESFLRPFVK